MPDPTPHAVPAMRSIAMNTSKASAMDSGSSAHATEMVAIARTRGLSCPCSAMRCCMDGATRRPIVAMSRVRPATASGTRKPRQLVEQFLEDAVELKPEKDLCAEDEKAAFVEGDLEFAFESHHRLRGDNVIAYAEPTFGGSLCKPLAGRQGPKRPDSNKTPAGDGRGSCVEQRLPSLRVVPVVNVLSDLILGEAVAFLNFALKLISLAIDGCEVVVG